MGIATLDLRLSAGTQKALKIAQSVAREHMHAAFSAPHLLKALLHKDLGLEQQLWQMDYDVYYIEEWADVRLESCRKSSIPREAPAGDDDIAGILEEADNIRLQLNEEELARFAVRRQYFPGVEIRPRLARGFGKRRRGNPRAAPHGMSDKIDQQTSGALERRLGPLDAAMIVIGSMIGSGIFIT